METNPFQVKIPLLNPNEPEAKLVFLAIEEGQYVEQGDLLCTLETTKSTAELTAERDGYIINLIFSEGELVKAGTRLCYLSENKDWQPEIGQPNFQLEPTDGTPAEIPSGLRISKPALMLAQKSQLDLNALPIGPLVTEKFVREIIARSEESVKPEFGFNAQDLIVYGGGGHGKSVIDLIRTNGVYHIHGIVDDGLEPGSPIMGSEILGGREILPELREKGIGQAVNAVGGIGDISSRVNVFRLLAENGFVCPALGHPSAVIEPSAQLSPGIQIFPQAYVGSETILGFGVIVNTGAIISHECRLSDYSNISPGAVLAGDVEIGQRSLIGMGVTVNLGVKIGENSKIGNGATIKSDVPAGSIIRAGAIWPEG